MASLEAINEIVHNNSSNQSSSADNSLSLTVQYETVANDQQYESIADTGPEQVTARYETVHNNSLGHIGEVGSQGDQLESRQTPERWVNNVDNDEYWLIPNEQVTQVNQLGSQPTADHWVSNIDDDGYWLVPNDQQSELYDADGYVQVLIDDGLTLSEQCADCNQHVRQAARVDSHGYLQPVVNNDAEVHALPLVSLNSNDVAAAESDIINQLHLLHTAQDDNTPPNPLYTDKTTHHLVRFIQQDYASPNPLHAAQDDTSPYLPYTAQNHRNRPRLPTPLDNNQPASSTTSANLKLPVRLQSCEKLINGYLAVNTTVVVA
jgi:hypothetical protein